MTVDPTDVEDHQTPVVTPGDLLIEARQKLGYSEEEMADRLKVTIDYIRALESCAYDRLPGLTFIRGYIRGYAQILELDPNEIIAAFDDFVGEQTPTYKTTTVRIKPAQTSSASPMMKWISFLILAGVVGSTYYWWHTQQQISTEGDVEVMSEVPQIALVETDSAESLMISSEQEPLETSVIEPAVVVATTPAMDDAVTTIAEAELVAPAKNTAIAVENTAIAVPQESLQTNAQENTQDKIVGQNTLGVVAENTPVQSALPVNLEISFNAQCWVEVKGEESGRVLVASLRSAVKPVMLAVDEPVRILLGDVKAVDSFIFEGKSVALADFTRGKIANLTLGNRL